MPLLKGIHCDHFGVEIASEVRIENCVSAQLNYFTTRVDQHGADTIVACPRSR